jgi:hypothetical protein
MVVDGYRELLLGSILANYILIEILFQLKWLRKFMRSPIGLVVAVVFEDRITNRNALVTNVSSGIIAWRGD